MCHSEREVMSAQSHALASEALFTGNPNKFIHRESGNYSDEFIYKFRRRLTVQRPFYQSRKYVMIIKDEGRLNRCPSCEGAQLG
jgi:hypothetical protein